MDTDVSHLMAICSVSTAPIRAESNHTSEMVSQLLFGEIIVILKEIADWAFISSADQYQGWVSKKQFLKVSHSFISHYHKDIRLLNDNFAFAHNTTLNCNVLLFKGSKLPYFNKGKFLIGDQVFSIHAKVKHIPAKFDVKRVLRIAQDFIGTPYLWGGRSVSGMDCSGFVQLVFEMAGYKLPRNASQQVNEGIVIDFIDETLPGDLAFFGDPEGGITHVGIISEMGKIIHASGQVRIDLIDYFGIFNEQLKTYTHNLRVVKRLS